MVGRHLTLGALPYANVFRPSGLRCFGARRMLEVTTPDVLAAVKVGQEPCFITFTPDNQYALVVNHRSGDLAVIRLATITQGGSQRRSRTAPLFTMVPVGVGPVSAGVSRF